MTATTYAPEPTATSDRPGRVPAGGGVTLPRT